MMFADVELNAFFDMLWDSTPFRVVAVAAVLIAIAALRPSRKGR